MIPRLEDWPQRLEALIQAAENVPSKWGERDCCLFAADVVLALTDVDPAAEFRGKYHDAWGAGGVLRRILGVPAGSRARWFALIEDAAKKICEFYGFAQIPVAQARRGDIVFVYLPKNSCLGVVAMNGTEVYVPRIGKGLMRLPLPKAGPAWRVG